MSVASSKSSSPASPQTSRPRIVKSIAASELVGAARYDFAELQQRCDRYIESVREQSRGMLADAQEEARSIREQARQQAEQTGFARGLSCGQQELEQRVEQRAQERFAERLQQILPALETAAAELVRQREHWLCDWEGIGVRLSLAIAERILHRQLTAHPEAVQEMFRETLQLAVGWPEVIVRMSPLDVQQLGDEADAIVARMTACAEARVVADPQVTRGGCLIESRHGTVDARLESQLGRIAEELVPDDDDAD